MKLRRDFLASMVSLAGVSAMGVVAPVLKAEAQHSKAPAPNFRRRCLRRMCRLRGCPATRGRRTTSR